MSATKNSSLFGASRWAGVLLPIVLAACSSGSKENSDSSGAADVQDAYASCAKDTRALAYSANMTQSSMAGKFTVALVTASPAPPGVDNNTWTIKLLDASGQLVTDATFPSIKAWMPDHGHGSSATPYAMSNGDGTYTVQPLYLFMPGIWQITFNIKSGSTSDAAVFTFCIGG